MQIDGRTEVTTQCVVANSSETDQAARRPSLQHIDPVSERLCWALEIVHLESSTWLRKIW